MLIPEYRYNLLFSVHINFLSVSKQYVREETVFNYLVLPGVQPSTHQYYIIIAYHTVVIRLHFTPDKPPPPHYPLHKYICIYI